MPVASNLFPAGRIDYAAELNPAQHEAVTTVDGPILVAAGAGSGKTRTLVYRVAYLVDQGVPPESVLLLTFTRKAAAQMIERAGTLVGGACARVSGGTFHSLAHLLLRRHAGRLGYPGTFGVMDREDMEELLGRLRQQTGPAEKDKRFPKRSTLATIISKAANKSLPLNRLIESEYIHLREFLPEMTALALRYQEYKKENALLDFDDLLIRLARLLAEDEELRERIASSYQYLMVDEYQDTNPLQAEIVLHLGSGHRNVMVVGDDAQSIYSFRGASFHNIMNFPRLFPGTRVIRLEENYRSRQPILDLTNHIISRARDRYDKTLFTRRQGGSRPTLLEVSSQKEQSLFVCDRIRAHLAEGVSPTQIAVLFRAASHSFDLEIELLRHDIDYVKHGGRRFLEAAHIKDLLCLLRVLANPSDAVSLIRAASLMDGVGEKGASQVAAWVGGQRERLLDLAACPGRGKLKEALKPLAALFKEIGPKGTNLATRVDRVWEFYQPLMKTRFDDHPARMPDVNEFLRLARGYASLVRFLADMALEPPNTGGPQGSGAEKGERLVLSTIHSAKGLEWRIVFIIWATEGRFPPVQVLNRPEELEEERRLMYVAATRAEERLYIVAPLEREGAVVQPRISRFLADVPPHLLDLGRDEPEVAVRPPRYPTIPGPGPEQSPAGPLTRGDRVTHPVFGLGRVLDLPGGRRIRVDFDHFGTKTLAADYAGLKRI